MFALILARELAALHFLHFASIPSRWQICVEFCPLYVVRVSYSWFKWNAPRITKAMEEDKSTQLVPAPPPPPRPLPPPAPTHRDTRTASLPSYLLSSFLCLSVFLSPFLFLHLCFSVYLSLSLSVCLCLSGSLSLSVFLFI